MKFDFKTILICMFALVATGFAIRSELLSRSAAKEKTKLLNELAAKDKTIELSNGVFVRLTSDIGNLKSLLDNSQSEVHALTEQIEAQNQRIISLNQVVLKWKKAYEGVANAQQSEIVPPEESDSGLKLRTRVDFNRDFGHIKVSGYTVTNPAEAFVKVEQGKPLVLTLALSQGDDGKWKTFVITSDDNIEVDLRISAIDLKKFAPKWFEKIGVTSTLAVGDGLYTSVGLSVDIGKLTVGPNYGFYTENSGTKMYGLSVVWRPFSKR